MTKDAQTTSLKGRANSKFSKDFAWFIFLDNFSQGMAAPYQHLFSGKNCLITEIPRGD
jgi:hypothetical protein